MFRDCRSLVFLIVAGCGLLPGIDSSARAQMATAAPPQQMISNGVGPYPSTADASYPSTATPAASGNNGNFATLPYNDALNGAAVPAASNGAVANDPLYVPYGSPEAMSAAARSAAADPSGERLLGSSEPWSWQLLPDGLMYKSYLAGTREPRLGTQWVHDRHLGWQWDSTLGGRVGLLRYGTDNNFWPEGWQLDMEGAAFVRMNMEHNNDVDDVDFRAGMPLTTRQGPWEFKFGYYHYCSHRGDEYLVRNHTFSRINYVRDTLVLGAAVYLGPDVRLYSEAGWAFYTDGGAEPWEFQFGVDCSSNEPSGPWGSPFFAINCHLHEETDFSGNLCVQTGWQWRGRTGRLFRLGMQYFNGLSDQAQSYNAFEEQIGLGAWYDY